MPTTAETFLMVETSGGYSSAEDLVDDERMTRIQEDRLSQETCEVGSPDSDDVLYGASADAEGSFFLAGQTFGSFDGATANEGSGDFAVAKIDSDGSLLWSWQEGTEGGDALTCAAATDDGGVVVGGDMYNGVAYEGDFTAIKFDSDGAVEWSWQEGTVDYDGIRSCFNTADGHVVLAGYTRGDWEETNLEEANMIVVKLDVADGTVLWRYQAGASLDGEAYANAATGRSDGSIVLGGHTTADWDGELIGSQDFAAVALDEDGTELWRWQDGAASVSNAIYGVAALSDGSVVLVGYTEGDYDGENAGGNDFVVVKLDADGVVDWTWQGGTEYDDEFKGVATGIDGTSVIMAGYTKGSWVNIHETEGDGRDFAAMSMNADGALLWTYQSGTDGDEYFRNVAVRPDGAALLLGSTEGEFQDTNTTETDNDFAAVLIETGSVAPFPIAAPPPAPTPSTTPVTPAPGASPPQPSANTSAPAPVAVEPSTSSTVPLWALIGGSVCGLALLAIVGAIVVKRGAKKRGNHPTAAAYPSALAYPRVSGGGNDGAVA